MVMPHAWTKQAAAELSDASPLQSALCGSTKKMMAAGGGLGGCCGPARAALSASSERTCAHQRAESAGAR